VTLSSLILGLAERMIRLACLRLPEADRDECYREWTAELPAIFDDSEISPTRRAIEVLSFAADQLRGTLSLRRTGAAVAPAEGFVLAMGDYHVEVIRCVNHVEFRVSTRLWLSLSLRLLIAATAWKFIPDVLLPLLLERSR
jgi:hypothetical protein